MRKAISIDIARASEAKSERIELRAKKPKLQRIASTAWIKSGSQVRKQETGAQRRRAVGFQLSDMTCFANRSIT